MLWTRYRFVVRQLLPCMFEPQFVPLSKALYHNCFINGQRCKCWSRRPKLTSLVISDIKPTTYIFKSFVWVSKSLKHWRALKILWLLVGFICVVVENNQLTRCIIHRRLHLWFSVVNSDGDSCRDIRWLSITAVWYFWVTSIKYSLFRSSNNVNDRFNVWNHRRSQFRPMGPTFTSLFTEEASVVKYLAQGHKKGSNTQRNNCRTTKR